jgi:hypothetical protein
MCGISTLITVSNLDQVQRPHTKSQNLTHFGQKLAPATPAENRLGKRHVKQILQKLIDRADCAVNWLIKQCFKRPP